MFVAAPTVPFVYEHIKKVSKLVDDGMKWNASFFLSFITGSLFHHNVLYEIEGEYCKIYLKHVYIHLP